MTRDQCGLLTDHSFVDWCKRIAMYSTGSTAASNAATEHADDDGAFRKMAKYFLTHELTPEQKNDPVYRFREDKSVTTKQRSLINNVLRKNLGDPRVAYYIFQHGVPTLLDPPLHRKRLDCYKEPLQNMLEEFMTWHFYCCDASLSDGSILTRSQHKGCQTLTRGNGELNDDAKKTKRSSD